MDELQYFEYNGTKIPYRIEFSERRRTVGIAMGADGILVAKAPRRMNGFLISSTLRKNAARIAAIYEAGRERLADPDYEDQREVTTGEDGIDRVQTGFVCRDGELLPFGDQKLLLHVIPQPGFQKPCISARGNDLYVELPVKEPRESYDEQIAWMTEAGQVALLVEAWYRKQAERVLTGIATREAARMGVTFEAVSIRNQKTRWGSCSSEGKLSFNVRLMLMPSKVAEYVVIHELCHRVHMDHSREFWAMVAQYDPDYQEAVRFLKEKYMYYRLR